MKFYWTWTDKKEVKIKREAQLPWELRDTKEEGSIKCCMQMNKRVWEKERHFCCLPHQHSSPSPWCSDGITCISHSPLKAEPHPPRAGPISIKHCVATSRCPKSTSILPLPIFHGKHQSRVERAQTLEPIKPGPTSTSATYHLCDLEQL